MIPQHLSLSNEWYTPKMYIDAVHDVMGGIVLDPASCEEANKIVRAEVYWTAEDDGLLWGWFGTVFLNPPYGRIGGRSSQEVWFEKLEKEYLEGRVDEAIGLGNAAASAKWFHRMLKWSVCITDHRIRFISPDGEKNQPPNGNIFVYMGPNDLRFAEVFRKFGTVFLKGSAIQ